MVHRSIRDQPHFTGGSQMNSEPSTAMNPWRQIRLAIDHFWMRPADLRTLDLMRRCYGILLLIYVGALWVDRHKFFASGSFLPSEAARGVLDPDALNIYTLLPDDPFSITLSLLLLASAGVCLILGYFPRVTATAALCLLTLVQHSNMMLCDAEDTVFRLFAFFFVFAPPWKELKAASADNPQTGFPVWPIRFFQLQMCIIYFCAGIQKSNGAEWIDGTAVYYTLRLDDMTMFHLPGWMAESVNWLRALTWGTLVFELLFPFLIWNRWCRWPCLCVALLFHLMLEYSFNLHLFHPIMLVGLMSFVSFDEWQALWQRVSRRLPASGAQQPSA